MYAQIETLSKAQKPRRSKSFTRGGSDRGSPAPRSPPVNEAVLNSSPPTLQAKLRVSSESLKRSNSTNFQQSAPPVRSSLEKMKAARMFGRSSSSENGHEWRDNTSEMTRVQSEGSITGSITSDFMVNAEAINGILSALLNGCLLFFCRRTRLCKKNSTS